ncbi:hypothetical protein [Variovorax sp. MHTC-1]|nr:hypothetical protein [Variovorax sp. MHTC-1]
MIEGKSTVPGSARASAAASTRPIAALILVRRVDAQRKKAPEGAFSSTL